MFIEYLNLITAHLRLALNFLSCYRFSFQKYKLFDVSEIGEELNIATNETHAECAMCLSEVEEGEEIRELRCEHIFHRVCLDRWLDFRQVTCPLCRGCLAPRRTSSPHQPGTGVLLFKFSSVSSMDDRDRWWLR